MALSRELSYSELRDERFKKLREYAMECLRAHFTAALPRFSTWAAIDRNLKALKKREKGTGEHQRLDESAKGLDYIDDINIPMGYFVLDTLESQLDDVFFQRDEIWQVKAVNVEEGPLADKFGAKLRAADKLFGNVTELKNGIHCAIKYNEAWTSVSWGRVLQSQWRKGEDGERREDRVLKMEGCQLVNVSPFRIIRDPAVAPDRPERMRFLGSWSQMSRNEVVATFGVDYEDLEPVAWLWSGHNDEVLYRQLFGPAVLDNFMTAVVDLYVDIIPAEMGLGSGTKPEVWHLVMAGPDKVLRARRAKPPSGKFPYFPLVPVGDGEDPSPVGIMEMIRDMIAIYNWLYAVRMAAVRNDLTGDYLVNERLVNIEDLKQRDPYRSGNVYRLTRFAWQHPNAMEQAIKRLQFSHDTKDFTNDAAAVFEMIKIISMVVDPLSGIANDPQSRRTAEEINRVIANASKRVKKLAGRIHDTWLVKLGNAVALYTQAFSENSVKVQDADGNWHEVDWDELLIPIEVNVGTGYLMQDPQQLAQSWQTLLEFIQRNPETASMFKITKMLEEFGRAIGIPNLRDFLSGEGIAAIQAANILAAQGAGGAGGNAGNFAGPGALM